MRKKIKINYIVFIMILILFLGVMVNTGCKKATEEQEEPSPVIYTLTISDVRDVVTEQSENWGVTLTTGNGSVVSLHPGESTVVNSGTDGEEVDILVDGGTRDVLYVKPGPNPEPFFPSIVAYSVDGQALHLNLREFAGKTGQGSNLYLVLYKIDPASINVSWAREALSNRAVFNKSTITAYPHNDGYSKEEFDKYRKGMVKDNLDKIISQLNDIFNGFMTIRYDPNATSGDIVVALSPDYYNPSHLEHVSNGVINDSMIFITGDMPGDYVLEEFYQSLGVRHDIGSSIVDEIANSTIILNPFGKKLMFLNYNLPIGYVMHK